ncbi:hypothetical protein QQF64_035185 [Cirrhinus molitorella]|uniref:Uncharacterized protein n=1 Tax=Cirrhinus molitorella TaxID=172907 RepID=A0ABR3NFN4_9TELE
MGCLSWRPLNKSIHRLPFACNPASAFSPHRVLLFPNGNAWSIEGGGKGRDVTLVHSMNGLRFTGLYRLFNGLIFWHRLILPSSIKSAAF